MRTFAAKIAHIARNSHVLCGILFVYVRKTAQATRSKLAFRFVEPEESAKWVEFIKSTGWVADEFKNNLTRSVCAARMNSCIFCN